MLENISTHLHAENYYNLKVLAVDGDWIGCAVPDFEATSVDLPSGQKGGRKKRWGEVGRLLHDFLYSQPCIEMRPIAHSSTTAERSAGTLQMLSLHDLEVLHAAVHNAKHIVDARQHFFRFEHL